MILTRREFAAATAGGLSLFSFVDGNAEVLSRARRARHVHLELPAGPYERAEVARLVADAAALAGLGEPESATALGAQMDDVTFPAEFAATVVYPGGIRIVVRASKGHSGDPEVTIRGDRGTMERKLSS